LTAQFEDNVRSPFLEERMSEFKLDEGSLSQASTAPQWLGLSSIPIAHQLNEQCIDMLCAQAADPSMPALPCVAQNRNLWRHLYPEARKRLAAFPFVIVAVRSRDDDWWPQAAENYSRVSLSGIPTTLSESLLFETLLFARQTARENINVAKVTFGMSAGVAAIVGQLTLAQVRAIALANPDALTVRWSDNPELWRELLLAARDGDDAALEALRHHAKRLFCGEFIK
jgi:hypothetical protein